MSQAARDLAAPLEAKPAVRFSLSWSTVRELAAIGALLGVVVSGAAIVVLSASTQKSFGIARQESGAERWVVGPLAHHAATMTAARFILLLCAMWASYVLAIALADAVRPRWAIGAIVFLTVLFTVGPPLFSRDVFNYIDYGRLGVVHHINPYAQGPAAAPHDPIYPFVRWRHTPSAYGPLFTWISYALAPLGLTGALWSFKALAGAATLGCVALVWRCAQRYGSDPVRAVIVLGLNPIMLVFAVAGAHNDVLAVLVLLAAMTFAIEKRAALGGASLVAAVAVKATAGLAIPFMVLGSRRPVAMLGGMAAATAVFGAVGYAVFGSHVLEPFNLAIQHQHYYNEQSVPQHVAVLLGIDPRSHTVRSVATVVAVVAIAALLVRTALHRAEWLTNAGWAAVALLVGTTFMLVWYTIWVLPFAAVTKDRRLLYGALSIGTFVVAARLYFLNE
jgi:hypothetical protein